MQNSSFGSKKARIITLEEHFVTPAFLNSPESKKTLRADPSSSQPQVAAMAKIMESAAELERQRGQPLTVDNLFSSLSIFSHTFRSSFMRVSNLLTIFVTAE